MPASTAPVPLGPGPTPDATSPNGASPATPAGGAPEAPVAPPAALPRTPFAKRVGLQLFSLRNQLDADLPGTLTLVQQMGFQQVEAYSLHGQTAAQLRAMLDERELSVGGFLAPFERFEADAAGVIEDAQVLGAPVVGCAWIPHPGGYTAETNERAIEVFTNAGLLARTAGLRFVYHPHGYEFHPGGIGETLLDQMIQRTETGVVDFEMDTFWIVHAGADPVAYLNRYPDRFPLFHLKDMREDTPRGLTTGSASPNSNVQLGTGIIGFSPIIQTAEAQGEAVYFIEDESNLVVRTLPLSLQYLLGLQAQ